MKLKSIIGAALLCLAPAAYANKVINADYATSKKVFDILVKAGAVTQNDQLNVTGIYCEMREETQRGDTDMKPEVLVTHTCNIDAEYNINDVTGQAAEQLMELMARLGAQPQLARPIQNDGTSTMSLFIQSVSCNATLEQAQAHDMTEKTFEVVTCQIEI